MVHEEVRKPTPEMIAAVHAWERKEREAQEIKANELQRQADERAKRRVVERWTKRLNGRRIIALIIEPNNLWHDVNSLILHLDDDSRIIITGAENDVIDIGDYILPLTLHQKIHLQEADEMAAKEKSVLDQDRPKVLVYDDGEHDEVISLYEIPDDLARVIMEDRPDLTFVANLTRLVDRCGL